MFISIAEAAETVANNTAAAPTLASFAPLVLVFAVFYFMMIRPQMKKQKAHQAMLNAIKKGDKVITNGGIYGIVVKDEDDGFVQIEIAPNVKIRILKSAVSDVVDKNMSNTEEKKDQAEIK